MWDKPSELNTLSGLLLAVSTVLVLYGVLHHALRSTQFALRAVRLVAVPQQVDVNQIVTVVRNELRGNFFTVDLEKTQQTFEKLPWVRKASVRRQFPWQLEVELEEHVALAIWKDGKLVNTHGELFSAQTSQTLPNFTGQSESAAEMTRMYSVFTQQLAPLKQQIVQISLSLQHAWQLHLGNGMLLKLGHDQAEQRLARFVETYPWSEDAEQKTESGNTVKYVDLRYRDGFAVMYKQSGKV